MAKYPEIELLGPSLSFVVAFVFNLMLFVQEHAILACSLKATDYTIQPRGVVGYTT